MDNILVGIIVAGALVFCIRSFIKTYKGEGGCNCSSGCGSSPGGKDTHCSLEKPFKMVDKN